LKRKEICWRQPHPKLKRLYKFLLNGLEEII
jgi:hypothetical protein